MSKVPDKVTETCSTWNVSKVPCCRPHGAGSFDGLKQACARPAWRHDLSRRGGSGTMCAWIAHVPEQRILRNGWNFVPLFPDPWSSRSPIGFSVGSRTFAKDVPLRNRFGNVLTRGVFRLVIGRALGDTQTGLRGIPRYFLAELMRLETGRYEFELEMLVRAIARDMTIEELPIATVYGDFA